MYKTSEFTGGVLKNKCFFIYKKEWTDEMIHWKPPDSTVRFNIKKWTDEMFHWKLHT